MIKYEKVCFSIVLTLIAISLLSPSLSKTYLEEKTTQALSAESVYNTEFMNLPQSTGSIVIVIPNEAHESWSDERHKLLSEKNPYFLPTKINIPNGTSIAFLNADAPWDTPHPHTINIESSGDMVYSTDKMNYGDSSEPKILSPGNYSIIDADYSWMKGIITVREQNSNGSILVGAFYVPTNEVANKKDIDGKTHPGSLRYYRTEFPKNGFEILSEYNFSHKPCNYCEGGYWPDNKSGEHTLIVFSTNQPLNEALKALQKLAIDNVYV